jgi:hypothetical protein
VRTHSCLCGPLLPLSDLFHPVHSARHSPPNRWRLMNLTLSTKDPPSSRELSRGLVSWSFRGPGYLDSSADPRRATFLQQRTRGPAPEATADRAHTLLAAKTLLLRSLAPDQYSQLTAARCLPNVYARLLRAPIFNPYATYNAAKSAVRNYMGTIQTVLAAEKRAG